MAAQVLATLGCRVTVFEQMGSVGRKFLLAGRSGLNLTHSEPTPQLLSRYSCASDVLDTAITRFDQDAVRQWAADLGEDTFVGSSGRVFVDSWRAAPLLRAWLRRLASLGVTVETRHRWIGLEVNPDHGRQPARLLLEQRPPNDEPRQITVETDAVVLALGGASWPRTGSDGRWTTTLSGLDIAVTPLEPSNAAANVAWSVHFRDRFEGIPLKNVAVTCASETIRGDLMVTRQGLEGTPVYAHSRNIRAAIHSSTAALLEIDLRPDSSPETLEQRLALRRRGESTSSWLRRCGGLDPVAIGIVRESTENQLPSAPREMAALLKGATLRVDSLGGLDRSISSAGGLSMSEVDEHSMLSRLPGLFVAGEMLDWDAPTGGYLLQATLSSAVAAANGAYRWLVPEQGAAQ
jgi:uncharacterized flavoprotein (TIGR03862 family)